MPKMNISPIHFIDNHTNVDFGLEFKILLLVSDIRPLSGKQISFKPQILRSCLLFVLIVFGLCGAPDGKKLMMAKRRSLL